MKTNVLVPNPDTRLLREQIGVCNNILTHRLLKTSTVKRGQHFEALEGILNMLETTLDIAENQIRIKK